MEITKAIKEEAKRYKLKESVTVAVYANGSAFEGSVVEIKATLKEDFSGMNLYMLICAKTKIALYNGDYTWFPESFIKETKELSYSQIKEKEFIDKGFVRSFDLKVGDFSCLPSGDVFSEYLFSNNSTVYARQYTVDRAKKIGCYTYKKPEYTTQFQIDESVGTHLQNIDFEGFKERLNIDEYKDLLDGYFRNDELFEDFLLPLAEKFKKKSFYDFEIKIYPEESENIFRLRFFIEGELNSSNSDLLSDYSLWNVEAHSTGRLSITLYAMK